MMATDDRPPSSLDAQMRNAGLRQRDHRGLTPLDDARALVARRDAFRKGAGRMVGGHWVLDSDRL